MNDETKFRAELLAQRSLLTLAAAYSFRSAGFTPSLIEKLGPNMTNYIDEGDMTDDERVAFKPIREAYVAAMKDLFHSVSAIVRGLDEGDWQLDKDAKATTED